MSIREIRTYLVVCDCGEKEEYRQEKSNQYKLPEGWGFVRHYDCAMTGYSKVEETCPKCLQKQKCKSVLDIDTMGAQVLEVCELQLNHSGKHKRGDLEWS